MLVKAIYFPLDVGQAVFIVFLNRDVDQVAAVLNALLQGFYGGNDIFQRRALTPQILGPFRIVPNVRFGQFPLDFC